MIVTRYNPYGDRQMRKGFEMLNTLMGSLENSIDEGAIASFVPAVNTRVDDDAYYIEIDLPGVKKDDIEITAEDNVLTVSGERKMREELKEDDYYKVESRYGKFSRSFTLPEDADPEGIEAHMQNGVLEIVIPKRKDIHQVKKIDIK
ncbi:MAG: Hsp20/alpha crystallin family protein [Sulfurovum sp.]|nr:MAG: Hsp20/alpha crystallin family protein [Sulfurovum sp.]